MKLNFYGGDDKSKSAASDYNIRLRLTIGCRRRAIAKYLLVLTFDY